MSPSRFALAALLSALALAVGCGGGTPPAEAPPTPSATAETPANPAPPGSAAGPAASAPAAEPEKAEGATEPAKPTWKDLTVDQKREIMKTEVLPKMKAIFQEFDAKRFGEFRCTTCHGASAKEGKFAMPNPGLPKLDPSNDFAKHQKTDGKILKLMMERVSPEMAKILGIAPYDPAKNAGFGCFDCHTERGK